MDRKVIYNGRVSKLPMPKGTRPSDRENNLDILLYWSVKHCTSLISHSAILK